MASKIIVLGAINGKLKPAFTKLAALNSKNAFSLAIVTGNLFSGEVDDEAVTELLCKLFSVPKGFIIETQALHNP
jgi:hypothetical protein